MNEKTFDTEEQVQTKHEYNGTISCSALSGEAKLLIDKDGFIIDCLFVRIFIAYADIVSIAFKACAVHIEANGETITISRMGQSCEWFHRELLEAYNRKVLMSFNVTGAPELETEGRYSYDGIHGKAAIRVFSDCLCILPPDTKARRIPFVFMKDIKKDNDLLTITLNAGEVYSFSMLGFDLDPLIDIVTRHVRKQRDSDIAFVKKLSPALGLSESTKAGSLLPEGIAVQLKLLPPVLSETLEKKAKCSKMAAFYNELNCICDREHLAVGIKCLPEESFEALKQSILQNSEGTAELTFEQENAMRWVIWAAIPSKDGKTAVVEFAFPDEDAATYLFHIDREWGGFLNLLNRGMEASKLRREVFSLTEDALKNEANAEESMVIMRTPPLGELRKLFIGRVIHRSQEGWKNSLLGKLGKGAAASFKEDNYMECCSTCGARLISGAKFCGQCGTKLREQAF